MDSRGVIEKNLKGFFFIVGIGIWYLERGRGVRSGNSFFAGFRLGRDSSTRNEFLAQNDKGA